MHIEKVDRIEGSLLIMNSMINDGVAIPLGADVQFGTKV